MFETRDVGIKLPQWHTLIFEGQVRVDMRYVCPKDVKKTLWGTGEINLLEEVGSEARVRGSEGRHLARASPATAAKEDKGRSGLTGIAIPQENCFWKEVGSRKDTF